METLLYKITNLVMTVGLPLAAIITLDIILFRMRGRTHPLGTIGTDGWDGRIRNWKDR